MKKFLAVVLSAAMVLSLAACGGSDDKKETQPKAQTEAKQAETKQTEETTTKSAGETEGQTQDPAADGEDHTYELEYWANLTPEDIVKWNAPNDYKKIGMLVPDGTNEFYVGIANTAEKIFAEAGYELVWTGISGNTEAAVNAVDTWVTQGVDALVVMATDNSCEQACLRAMEAGVLVVLGSTTFESYHVWCCQDYYDIGMQTAKMAADWLTENYGDDAAYLTIGAQAVELQTLKTQGIQDGMEKYYPKGTCVGQIITAGDPTNEVETLLSQHPETVAVVTWHTNFSLPALQVAKSMGYKAGEFFVFGSQMTAQSQIEIADPDSMYVSDTWMGDQGKQYANVVLSLLSGGEITHWDYAPAYVVNGDNVDTYYEDYYKWLETQ
ncbi:MAG: sugar ABC transporter substrate-binding protein [Lachnospiraceae bacterium]|nr:sugar ABC transporter substrate-binding protein [Lachnospiraceae bacterium]